MSNFFQKIVDYQLFNEWAETLDWLVDDNKFDETIGWTSGYIGSLSKKIQKLDGFSKDKTYCHLAIKNLSFPMQTTNAVVALFSNGNSECKDFIRHIRNGIAHGKTNCMKHNNELFIEIKDYDSSGSNQTAYFFFPIRYITQTHKLYKDVLRSLKNQKGGKK